MKRSPFLSALLLGVLGLMAPASALTPAGTVITNQVRAEYLPPVAGDSGVALSNEVRTVVQPVCAASITPDGTASQPAYSVTRLPGETAAFAYTLVNAGNATFQFPLAGRVEGGSVSPALRVVQDLNGDGQLDAGEPDVTAISLSADESIRLLLVAGALTEGSALVNLVGSCTGGVADENNVSRVIVNPPPALTLSKTFTPALVRPGTETTVTLTATNSGAGESREVVVSDLLADQAAQGLTYVAGSALASGGTVEYTQDATSWAAQETAPVRGLRVRMPSLKPSETLRLSFRMLAAEAADGRKIPNTATVTTGGQVLSASVTADVRYLPAVAIGPQGDAEAVEGSDADRQSRNLGVVGQPVCFAHTARNTGDVSDSYRVGVGFSQGAASTVLLGEDGQPLAQPFVMQPGQTRVVRACYEPQQAGSLVAVLTIRGERGTRNATTDAVLNVEAGLPELRKSFLATTVNDSGQTVPVPQDRPVQVGDTLTYTLAVRNPYARALTDVMVADPLPAHLNFVSGSTGVQVSGGPGNQSVSWALGTLAAGETRTLTLITRVSDRAVDGEALKNIFTLVSSEFTTPLPSNETSTPVWKAKLVVTKNVSAREAAYGDRLLYTLTVTNQSETTAIVDAVVVDTAPRGLEYVPGSSTLNDEALADPDIVSGDKTFTATWTVPRIAPGGTVTLTYVSRVTPEASGTMINTVRVSGAGAGGVAKAIASNRAQATTRLNLLRFAPQADIVGIVYVDRNRNGLYDQAIDTPVSRARVLLAGGREALTDDRGRYSFGNVPIGTHALRLDPNTTPYVALITPQAGGLSSTRTAHVTGLTSVDFPLAPPGGDISVLRRTTLTVGDVRLEKTVFVRPGGYTVHLRILSPRVLNGVTLTDPLPAGATLKEGRNTFSGSFSAGETVLTYQFDWTGESRAATTDPSLSWRN
ncbi:DUF11 domain-containing protein [Deinococcus deserti]|uniref:DUF11 domain-containing protein n=1 Tax=Deinococcus deserti (strain DSM 17065 / CIP 109153 / LMG 22923 / VCD115) TaxID=546414 RepID=C1CYI8_DEIDV|nr:DUF11 domain-containing protein [Deinococcus deserti]ACO45009.1 Conserved hypothetical protein, precursor [Deinococcus deserti VCD115]